MDKQRKQERQQVQQLADDARVHLIGFVAGSQGSTWYASYRDIDPTDLPEQLQANIQKQLISRSKQTETTWRVEWCRALYRISRDDDHWIRDNHPDWIMESTTDGSWIVDGGVYKYRWSLTDDQGHRVTYWDGHQERKYGFGDDEERKARRREQRAKDKRWAKVYEEWRQAGYPEPPPDPDKV